LNFKGALHRSGMFELFLNCPRICGVDCQSESQSELKSESLFKSDSRLNQVGQWRYINCWFYGVLSRPALWSCFEVHSSLQSTALTACILGTFTFTFILTPDAMIHWRCVVVIIVFSLWSSVFSSGWKTYCCPLRRQNAVVGELPHKIQDEE